MDLLIGAVINHIVSTPPRLRAAMIERGPGFVRQLVDIVLAGVQQVLNPPHRG
jgi:hypothetical protein